MIAQHILFSLCSDQPAYGGYDYIFVGAIPSKYTCSICTRVLRDAHLTVCCGQHFCDSCLTHWLGTQQGRKTCPHCRQEDFQHVPNKERIREVNELKIRCINHREGCGWVGELGGLKSHLDSDKGCGYVEVTCTNKGCGERVSRKDLQTHSQEKCYYRPYECKHCGHKDTYRAITGNNGYMYLSFFPGIGPRGHYSKCPEYPLACPNWCGVTGIRRRAMPEHHSSCPLEPLSCTNKGCGERVSRKNLQTHSQERCYYRPYECEHCGHKDTYTAITGEQGSRTHTGMSSFFFFRSRRCVKSQNHYTECPEYPLACPNRCGVTGIRRRAMPDHHSSCPLEPLNCPFKDAGCTEKIARKDMEDHMTANQQKHMLLTFQSLQQTNQRMKTELQLLKSDVHKEIDSLEESIRRNTNTPESTAQSLSRMKSILQGSLDEIGDTLTFRVSDFPQLGKEKEAWHSPPFSIGDKVRVHLTVYPSGVGRGQGSHVSVSLILTEVVQKEEDMWLQYNVSVAAIGQGSATHTTLELCTFRKGDKARYPSILTGSSMYGALCSARFHFPSPGEVLRSEEQFLEIEEANPLLQNDAMTLELKLLEHQHHMPQRSHKW